MINWFMGDYPLIIIMSGALVIVLLPFAAWTRSRVLVLLTASILTVFALLVLVPMFVTYEQQSEVMQASAWIGLEFLGLAWFATHHMIKLCVASKTPEEPVTSPSFA